MLSQVKLIAEPWDVGDGGYQVGEFPPLWTEWNDQYRDTVRDFWRGLDREPPRPRLPALRVVRPLRRRRPPPVRLGQLRDRARRLHAARPGDLRPQAQRGQRRGQPRRHRQQPLLEPRRRGRDRRRGGPGVSDGARCATCSPRCCCPPASRCSPRATRWVAPRAATTTPTARTTRSPGSTGTSTPWQVDLLEFARLLLACVAPTRPCATGTSSRAGRRSRAAPRTSAGSAPDGSELIDAELVGDRVPDPGDVRRRRLAEGPHARAARTIVDASFLLLLHGGSEPIDFILPGAPWAVGYRSLLDTADEQPAADAADATGR